MANVRDFGATGDGTTDDTRAIQHAVEQGDGELIFPRGTYRLTRPVLVELRTVGPSAIVGCHISYCPHAGIKIQRSEIRNLQITGCDIEYNHDPDHPDSADVWIDAREGTVREGTIASCTIQARPSPGGVNVRIEGPDVE